MAATIDQVIDALLDNADFEESLSVTKAQLFSTAAKRFLILSPQSQSDQGSSLTMSPATIENLMHRALEFIAANRVPSSVVRFLSVSEGFR
jgi:hypothetical protein